MVSNLVYYAMGGGLGHCVRARAFLHTIGYAGRATVVTASKFASDPRVTEGFDVLRVPVELERDPESFRSWIASALDHVSADCLCVDTFPAGILGELHGLHQQGLQLWHVARSVRWQNYAPVVRSMPLRFDRCWRVEALNREQHAFLDAHCTSIADIELCDPPLPPQAAPLPTDPYWLVVHSGPQAEVADLVAYANEIRALEAPDVPLWVITPAPPSSLPEAALTLDVFPAQPYFASAQRIFTAAGFNIVRQTARHRHKQTLLPMPRRFDDQFERARQVRTHETVVSLVRA